MKKAEEEKENKLNQLLQAGLSHIYVQSDDDIRAEKVLEDAWEQELREDPEESKHKCSYVAEELGPANDLVLDLLSIILRTGLKNIDIGIELAGSFSDVLDSIQKVKSDEEKFEVFHFVSLMRDTAKNVFHGSVVGSVLDGNMDLRNFIDLGKHLC